MTLADDLTAALDAHPSRDGASVVAWRFELLERQGLRAGMQAGQVGGPYEPPGLSARVRGELDLRWSDGLRTRAPIDRAVVGELDDRLADWRAAASADRWAPPIPEPSPLPEVETEDRAVAALVVGEPTSLFELLGRSRSTMRAAGARQIDAAISATRAARGVRSSRGLDVRVPETTFSLSVSADDLYEATFARRRLPRDDEVDELLERAGRTAADLQREEALPALPCRVLFTPEVVESFVGRFIAPNLAGPAVVGGRSIFVMEDFAAGKAIFREDLDLVVDTTLPLELASSPCSAEGVPGGRVALIRSGRLVTPTLDAKYAARVGLPATPVPRGHPPFLLEVASGTVPFDAACRQMGDGLIVSFVMGLHTQDSRTGEYAVTAPQAQVVRRGKPSGRAGARLGGNFREHLRDSSARFVRFDHACNPGLLLDRVAVRPA